MRPLVLGQDRSETKKNRCLGLAHCGLDPGLAGLMLCCETRSCHARCHNDLEGHGNFQVLFIVFPILVLERHYCGDQQWRLSTESKMRQDHVYFGWSWSCYFGLGLGLVSSGLGLSVTNLSAPKSQLSWLNLSHWPMFSTPETSVHVLKKKPRNQSVMERGRLRGKDLEKR